MGSAEAKVSGWCNPILHHYWPSHIDLYIPQALRRITSKGREALSWTGKSLSMKLSTTLGKHTSLFTCRTITSIERIKSSARSWSWRCCWGLWCHDLNDSKHHNRGHALNIYQLNHRLNPEGLWSRLYSRRGYKAEIRNWNRSHKLRVIDRVIVKKVNANKLTPTFNSNPCENLGGSRAQAVAWDASYVCRCKYLLMPQ